MTPSLPCPVCGTPVDALRARHVAVLGGKVVAYCSAECRARAAVDAGGAPARARTPAAGIASPRTPPSGVPRVLDPVGRTTAPEEAPATGATGRGASERGPVGSPAPPPALASLAAAEVAPGSELTSGARQRKRRADSLDARSAWEWLDDEPAAAPAAAPPPRRRRARAGALAIAAAGAAVAVGYAVRSTGRDVPSDAPVAPRPSSRVDAGLIPAPTSAQVLSAAGGRARATLEDLLTSSPTAPAQRTAAAAALARTGHAGALEHLASELAAASSAQARVDLAYQLARGGDARGRAALMGALAGPSRDARLDAAQRLARLGDARGEPALRAAMAYSQYRIAAAAELAVVGDPAALRALEQAAADPASTVDERARATIALGRARRAEPEALRALLADKRNAAAAPVLAALGDAAATPVLHEQLGFEHVRVDAARALRRHGTSVDHVDGVRALERALATEAAPGKLLAAEAMLILAGPLEWAERP
jgi:HEAT repeat protein